MTDIRNGGDITTDPTENEKIVRDYKEHSLGARGACCCWVGNSLFLTQIRAQVPRSGGLVSQTEHFLTK